MPRPENFKQPKNVGGASNMKHGGYSTMSMPLSSKQGHQELMEKKRQMLRQAQEVQNGSIRKDN